MKLKKILYVTDIVGLGGGETSLLNHLDNLDRSKYLPIVLCSNTGMLTDELINREIEVNIIHWKQIKRISNRTIYFPYMSFLKLVVFLKKRCVDIIHPNSFNAMAVIAPAAKLCKLRVVWTCHGWWPTGKFTGKFINFFVDKVIAVSGFVENKLLKEGYVNSPKIIQIPLGIDSRRYSNSNPGEALRRQFRISKNSPLVGMIGRFQKIKGHHIFVEMAAELSRTHPKVRFVMVGSGVFGKECESDYGREVQELICKSGIKEKIHLTGFRQDIPQILKSLDVLIVPSEVETFGMVVLEALAAGVSVVSCATGGPTEIIENGENGFIIDKQDPIELAVKVKFLLDHPDIKKTIEKNGRKTVRQKYQIIEQVKKIEAIYEKLLK
jgi:glycosyltransferase involved in cell wall biosynthesis